MEGNYLATNNSSFPVLHRLPADLNFLKSKGGLNKCDWCGDYLPTDEVWECVGRLDHYLVCSKCHQQAIIH